MKMDMISIKKYIGYGLLLLSLFILILVISQGFGVDIWYDEVFSMGMAKAGYKDIIKITANDVHPPLYYFYLKFIVDSIHLFIPTMESAVIAKMASVLPMVLLFVIGVTQIRRKFGVFMMGIYLFLIVSMPQINTYMLEIRMYSLTMLFMIIAFLAGLKLITNDGDSRLTWVIFTVMGICMAYTQYYACIAIIALYFVLLVFFLYKKKKKEMFYLGIAALVSVLSYLPWIPHLLYQMQKVNSGYWIQPMTLRSILGCVKFIYLPTSLNGNMNYLSAVFMIAATFIVGVGYIVKTHHKRSKEEQYLFFTGLAIPAFVVISGFILSILNRPIFTYRYLIPCMSVYWFSVAFLLHKSINRRLSLLILIPFFIGAYFSTVGFYQEEHKKIVQTDITIQALDRIEKDALIVTNFDHVTAISSYYLSNSIYLYEGETDALIPQMFTNCMGKCTKEEMQKALSEGKTMYFFGSFNAREELIAEWDKIGITAKEEGSFLMERYWFNIYRLGVKGNNE